MKMGKTLGPFMFWIWCPPPFIKESACPFWNFIGPESNRCLDVNADDWIQQIADISATVSYWRIQLDRHFKCLKGHKPLYINHLYVLMQWMSQLLNVTVSCLIQKYENLKIYLNRFKMMLFDNVILVAENFKWKRAGRTKENIEWNFR